LENQSGVKLAPFLEREHQKASNSLADVRGMPLKFQDRTTRNMSSLRTEILAIPKPDFYSKDIFQRNEFRGLLVSDYQNVII
jgi:hypothetical protein